MPRPARLRPLGQVAGPTGAGRLDPGGRAAALAAMQAGDLDVLVVGGGVVGAGVALDAVTRGLRVGLIERSDWASGSSSRSSRLAHGGLRYLEHFEFGLVHEALSERGLLLEKLAPHLVRPVPFVLPLTRAWERPYLGAGVALYSAMSRASRRGGKLPGHRHLAKGETGLVAPGLRPDRYVGAIAFYDAQIDDAAHTVAVVRTAAAHGAFAASRIEVTGFVRDGARVVGARATDLESRTELEIRARVVVTATGVWTERTRALLDTNKGVPTRTVQPSLGAHLVVPRDAIDLHAALIARTRESVLFVLPWRHTWLVGTTDTPWNGDLDNPSAGQAEIDYLLNQANGWLSRPLRHDDVLSVYAGLRPLLAGAEAVGTSKLSREHAVLRPAPGFVQVTGGKYTTYRVMAADAVDAAACDLGASGTLSRTAGIPLVGADGFAELWASRHLLGAEFGLSDADIAALMRRYGTQLPHLLDLLRADPGLGRRLHPEARTLRAEVVYAALFEGARSVEDVLVRRTRLAHMVRDGARSAARDTAALLAEVLGWDSEQAAGEVVAYGWLPASGGATVA